MLVKYLGTKAVHIDSVFGTHLAWRGNDDVHEVSDEIGQKMVALAPLTFARVEPAGPLDMPGYINPRLPPEADGVLTGIKVTDHRGQEVRLMDAPRQVLARYAREEHGLMVKDGHSRADILGFIANTEETVARIAKAEAGAGADPPPLKNGAAAVDPPPQKDAYEKRTDKEVPSRRPVGRARQKRAAEGLEYLQTAAPEDGEMSNDLDVPAAF